MGFTDTVSKLIFALLVMAVLVFLTMTSWVIGPLGRLRRAERIMLVIMFIGVLMVMVYATTELLFHFVF
jgi:hypothetical protein